MDLPNTVLQEQAKYQSKCAVEFKSNMLAVTFFQQFTAGSSPENSADCFIHDVEIETFINSERQPQKHQKVTVRSTNKQKSY